MNLRAGNRIAWVLLAASASASIALLNPDAVAESGAGTPSPAPSTSASPVADSLHSAASSADHHAKSGCLVDPAAIEDLRKRREDIDAKAKELAARETEIKARERAIEEELAKLEDLSKQIDKGRGAINKQEEEKLAKVVETLETMSPKAAAQLLSTLNETLAVTAVHRLATPKLAKIMNLLEPEKAARLTESLTGVKSARKEVTANNEKRGIAADGASSAQSNQPTASARP